MKVELDQETLDTILDDVRQQAVTQTVEWLKKQLAAKLEPTVSKAVLESETIAKSVSKAEDRINAALSRVLDKGVRLTINLEGSKS